MTGIDSTSEDLKAMSKGSPKSIDEHDFEAAFKAWEEETSDPWNKDRQRSELKDAPADGPLAEGIRKKLTAAQRKKSKDAPSKAHASAQVQGPRSQHTRRMTEEALMREAFEALDVESFDPTAKFRGKGYDKAMDVEIIDEEPPPVQTPQSSSEGVRQSYTAEDRAFEELMQDADVQPLGGDTEKLRDAIMERPSWTREERQQSAAWKEDVDPETLAAPTLSKDQRKLLKKAKKYGHVPEVNLRLLRKHEALQTLEKFVRSQQVLGTRFVRVITGKGKRSKDHVVIKPAVLQWCEAPHSQSMILNYSPAPDVSGNYGVIVLELRRR